MRKLPLLFIFICIFSSVAAQKDFREGFIITDTNDTIQGLIDYSEGPSQYVSCDFIKKGTTNVKHYSPTELKGYKFKDDKYLVTKDVVIDEDRRMKVFMEVLVSGNASLLRYDDSYYLGKNDVDLYELENEKVEVESNGKQYVKESKAYVGIMSFVLSDCIDLRTRIQNISLDEKPLLKLIVDYNDCLNSRSIIYKEKKPWIKSSYGIITGVNFSKLNFQSSLSTFEHLNKEFDGSSSALLGLSFEILSPRMNERFSLSVEAYYLYSKYVSFDEQEVLRIIVRRDVSIEMGQIKIPIAIRYTFPEKKFTPYFNFGVSIIRHINSTTELVEEKEFARFINTKVEDALDLTKGQIGFWGGFGIKRDISERFYGYIESRYEQTSGLSTTVNIESNIRNLQILFGIAF